MGNSNLISSCIFKKLGHSVWKKADINVTGKRLGKIRISVFEWKYSICTVYIFSSFVHWKDLEIMTNPVAVSTPSTQTVVFGNHFPLEEIRASWEMADFRSEAGSVQDKSGIFCHTRWQRGYQRSLESC